MLRRATGVLLLAALLASPAWSAGNSTIHKQRFDNVEERRLWVQLQKRRKDLQEKEDRLHRREKELKTLQQEVEKKLSRLSEMRKKLEKLLASKEKAEQERIKDLSKMYQRMDPLKAARALNALEEDLAIGILSEMRSRSAGKILSNMKKQDAAHLTSIFSTLDR
jgi:flagellar motility protein MotE (MotC chaperone)